MKRSYFAQTALASTLFAVLAGGSPAAAQDVNQRLQTLERTIEALQSELAAVRAEAASAKVTAQKASDAAPKTKIEFRPSPTFTSEDGSASLKLRGRIELDYATHSTREGPAQFSDGTELRRARFGVDGHIFTDWGYRLEVDLAKAARSDRDGQEVDVKDAYIQYRGFKGARITIGQHKTPNSLERLTGSPQLTFLERSAPVNAFTDRLTAGGDFKAGISTAFKGANWTATAGLFGDNLAVTGTGATEEGWGINGRVSYAPIQEAGKVLHLGASGYWRRPGGNGVVRFRDRPEIAVDSVRLVDTGNISARSYHLYAGELAGVWGPVTAQAEYLRAGVNRTAPGLSNVNFDGGYISLSYLLTGETRSYKEGLFGRITPKDNLSLKDGGLGAFELAARFSTLNLDNDDILGGEQDNFTLGLNWYFNAYTRATFNWVRFDAERRDIVNKGDIFATRLVINW